MSLIIPANTLASGGFNVDNSVRLDGTSAYLYKVNPSTSSTNNKRGTVSCWVKKWGFPDNSIYLINAQNNDQERFIIQISNGDQIIGSYRNASGTNDVDISTSLDRVYRDPAAWFNVVVAWNTSDGTGGNRLKLYVNGEEQALTFSTDIAQNTIIPLNVPNYNSSYPITIGRNFHNGNNANHLPAYLSEFCFVDGQTLDGTSFGEFDEDSGIFKPIDISGLNFGGLGWHLQFKDSSALGTDSNDNGTWTTVGLAAVDQSTDTCTNNFATLNVLAGRNNPNAYYATFSEGNLKLVGTSSTNNGNGFSTMAFNTGKWYCEVKIVDADTSLFPCVGVITEELVASANSPSNAGQIGQNNSDTAAYAPDGEKVIGGTESSYGDTFTNNDIIGIAIDCDNGAVYFSKNGTFQASGDPTSGASKTNAAMTFTPGKYYFFGGSVYKDTNDIEFNFGSPPYAISSGNTDGNGYGNFEYAVPSSYYSLNTKNLAEYG